MPTERSTFQLDPEGPLYTVHALGDDIWVTAEIRNHLHHYGAHILVDPLGRPWIHINGLVCFPCEVGVKK